MIRYNKILYYNINIAKVNKVVNIDVLFLFMIILLSNIVRLILQ